MKKENIPLDELKKTIPFFIGGNGIVLLACGIYGLFFDIGFDALLGAAVGTIVSAANFYLMGVSAVLTLGQAGEKKAKRFAQACYSARFLGMFAIFGVLLFFKLINPLTALAPLFFPRIYYLFDSLFNKKYKVIPQKEELQ